MDTILKWDEWISAKIHVGQDSKLRPYLLMFEWSVHGVPWLISGVLLQTISYASKWKEAIQHRLVILNFGLYLDLAVIGATKVTVQRARPPYNRDDQVYEAPVADRFSFPSGHASRAAMLCTMCAHMFPQTTLYVVWFPVALGLSRVALGRHYLGDVLTGLALGYVEGRVALLIPMGVNRWLQRVFR